MLTGNLREDCGLKNGHESSQHGNQEQASQAPEDFSTAEFKIPLQGFNAANTYQRDVKDQSDHQASERLDQGKFS